MHQPVFTHSRTLVNLALRPVVMSGGAERQDLDDQVRCASDPTAIQLVGIADYQNVGLHDGIDPHVVFVGFRKPDIHGGDIGSAGLTPEGVRQLPKDLPGDVLMLQRRRRGHQLGDPVDQLVTDVIRPGEIVSVGVRLGVASRRCHRFNPYHCAGFGDPWLRLQSDVYFVSLGLDPPGLKHDPETKDQELPPRRLGDQRSGSLLLDIEKAWKYKSISRH